MPSTRIIKSGAPASLATMSSLGKGLFNNRRRANTSPRARAGQAGAWLQRTLCALGLFWGAPFTLAALPTVTLSANPVSVVAGSASTLTWSSTSATSCAASGAWSGKQATNGSRSTGALTAATTFTLTCTGADGSTAQSATVTTVSSSIITDIKVVNTGVAQTNVPITFGQVFAVGALTSGTSVAGTLSSGAAIPLQVNVKATHADGSVRHAIISAVIPNLAAGQTETITFIGAAMGSNAPISPATLLGAGFTSRIDVTISGVLYSASADSLLAGTNTQWLAGPIANEWIVSAPLKTAGNVTHPHLVARFAIRSYAGSNKTKVDVTVENNRTFTAGSQNFTYDSKIYVGGVLVDTITGLEHFHHARWHKSFWYGTAEPQVHLKHNTAYLIATKAVPNYDQTVAPAESALAGNLTNIAGKTGPMKIGLAMAYMPTTGAHTEIGPLPSWYVLYLLSMDKRAKDVMLGIADGSGSWPMHYRDETDVNDMPVRVDKTGTSANGALYRELSTHGNAAHAGPLPVPRCAGGSTTLCVTRTTPGDLSTEIVPDTAHQPSLAYLPYLVTGDYFYLEELQFWTAWNPLGTSAGYREWEKGLVKWDQLRAQGWGLRTLGQAAYITPDSHPLKQYLNGQVGNNLKYYNDMYTIGNQNQLGIINSHIGYTTTQGVNTGQAPWMDDFFTWSIGYLDELGFTEANGLLKWKAKYTVARMTDPGFCWILGASYNLTFRPSETSAIYTTMSDVYTNTFSKVATDGTKLTDTACGSQAMATWLKNNDGFIYITAGEMTGYSSSAAGFPSNMQPALAVAAVSGIPNAAAAWTVFNNRSVKPNYSSEPQFAIVPRN